MVVRGVGDVLTDMSERAVDHRERRAVDETVDEWRGRILKDLLNRAGNLFAG
jgi:hypothetical protein